MTNWNFESWKKCSAFHETKNNGDITSQIIAKPVPNDYMTTERIKVRPERVVLMGASKKILLISLS